MLASQAIASGKAALIDATGEYKVGFRLQQRGLHAALDTKAQTDWTDTCNLIENTLDNIIAAYQDLGHANLTTDFIRLSDDMESPRIYAIADSLSVLILPHWDNAPYGRTVIPTYDSSACMLRLLSNASVSLLLVRWMTAMIALHRVYTNGDAAWRRGGIGCIASARSLAFLPLTMLPRLNLILSSFWTVGCNFEGEQSALSEAWFTMCPSIVGFVLLYYSVLDTCAKVLRRRVPDALFPLTNIALCMLHYFRLDLAANGYLRGVDSRVSTVVFSDEVECLQLVDYFTTDIAMRLNGRVYELVWSKVAILAVHAASLLLLRPLPVRRWKLLDDGQLSRAERALAVRGANAGGISSATFSANCLGFSLRMHRLASVGVILHLSRTALDKSGLAERTANSHQLRGHSAGIMCRLDDPMLLKVSFLDIFAIDIAYGLHGALHDC